MMSRLPSFRDEESEDAAKKAAAFVPPHLLDAVVSIILCTSLLNSSRYSSQLVQLLVLNISVLVHGSVNLSLCLCT